MSWAAKIRISTLTVVLAAVAAAASDQPFRLGGEEPDCADQPEGDMCWMELTDHPDCYVWSPRHMPREAVTWSAGCADGLAQGTGTLAWKGNSEEYEGTGLLRAGKQHGRWVMILPGGLYAGGPYMDRLRHGRWAWRLSSGAVEEGPYVDGKKHGCWVTRWPNGKTRTEIHVKDSCQFE